MPAIIAALTAAVQLAPEIEALIPLVQKVIGGQQLNDADLATLRATADAIDAAVAAKLAAQQAPPPPSP